MRQFKNKRILVLTLSLTATIALGLLIKSFNALEIDPTSVNGAPTIIDVSETVRPGENFNVAVTNLSSNKSDTAVYLTYINRNGILSRTDKLSSVSYSQNLIQLRAPINFPFGVWRIKVVTTTGSSSAYINRPRAMTTDSQYIAPSGKLRIWGRNLAMKEWISSINPKVTLVNGSSSLSTTYLTGNRFYMEVRAPANVASGKKYTVKVSNGYGGSYGYDTADFSVTGVGNSNDYFGLGTAWAKKLSYTNNIYNVKADSRLTNKAVGNGTTDDTSAIQTAINLASQAGGGVIYLPTGTYLVDGGLTLKSKTALLGDGKTKTIINYAKTYNYWASAVTFTDSASQAGISNLKIVNQNNSANTNMSIGVQNKATEVFLNNIYFDAGNSRTINLANTTRLLVKNSHFVFKQLNIWPILMKSSHWPVFTGNTIDYRCCRIHFTYADHGLVENNTLNLDSYYSLTAEEKGGFEVSYSNDLIVNNNLIRTTGDQFLGRVNEHEMILTQSGGDQASHAYGYGQVSSAGEKTLTDVGVNYGDFGSFTDYDIVAITSGNGAGQWRKIISHTANTLTLDKSWDAIPSAGSKYVIQTWTAYRLQIINNRFRDTKMSISFYNGGYDNLVAFNNSVDGGFMVFAGRDVHAVQDDTRYRNVLWKTSIIENNLSNPKKRHRTFIDVFAHQFDIDNWPLTAFNNEVRENTVTAANPDTNDPMFDYDPVHNQNVSEGLNAYLDWRHQDKINPNVDTVVGTIFQSNITKSFTADPYRVNGVATAQTIVDKNPIPSLSLPNDSSAAATTGNTKLSDIDSASSDSKKNNGVPTQSKKNKSDVDKAGGFTLENLINSARANAKAYVVTGFIIILGIVATTVILIRKRRH